MSRVLGEFEPCICAGGEFSQDSIEASGQAPDAHPILASSVEPVSTAAMRRDGRRCDGKASTMMHSASIANPMNSNTNASTAISPYKPLDL